VISAASILAKVHRDRYMTLMAKKYPGYAWGQNKGYGTKLHYLGIKKQGITKLHRKSFLK
jgi:ribonuclease HII